MNTGPRWHLFDLYRDWAQYGTLPLIGGYSEQPIQTMHTLSMIDITVSTYRRKNQKDYDWKKFSKNETALIRWVEGARNG